MTTTHTPHLDAPLSAHVDALNTTTPDQHAVEAAQLRLQRRLSGNRDAAEHRARPARTRWLAFAATAGIALALTLLPLMFGDRGGLAFADVQRHFQQFRTLTMRIEQGGAGTLLPIIDVAMNESGQVRTDVAGQLSVVVDPKGGQVLMLLHPSRSAMRFPIGVEGIVPAREALDWVEKLRHFKGTATPVSSTRLIDGQTAHGWSLAIGGARLELWADANGLPLAMSIGDGDTAVLDLQFRFRFDEPIAAGTFSTAIPAGYSLSLGLGG